jgi:hypothetical protein
MKTSENTIEIWQKAVSISSTEVVLEQLFLQLTKDFERVGLYLDFQLDKEPRLWIPQVSQLLSKLEDYQLNQLLYIIDLPEKWSSNMKNSSNVNDQLAEGILYRELVKIYYRLNFKT